MDVWWWLRQRRLRWQGPSSGRRRVATLGIAALVALLPLEGNVASLGGQAPDPVASGLSRRPAAPLLRVPSAEAAGTSFRNQLIAGGRRLFEMGARPRWSPVGDQFVFDSRNLTEGHSDLYIANRAGQVTASLTDGRHVNQRHNGNGVYYPRGGYIVFVSEEQTHFLDYLSPYGQVPYGEPGLGLFSNLWATDGQRFWKLTNIPLKLTADDGLPVYGSVNPRFSFDGATLVWTERYAEGGNNNWGKWRLKAGDFVVGPNGPALNNQRVLYEPTTGTYVTAMRFVTPQLLLVAGNLNGQHEYGMDLYLLNLSTRSLWNLTTSPDSWGLGLPAGDSWEEGACIAPSGKIVFMSNAASSYQIDPSRDWVGQPVERDYFIMNWNGTGKQRLTYFNDPTAPEYQGWRSVTIACDISPDGRTLAATVGRDYGDATTGKLLWQLWLIDFVNPL